MRLRGAREFYLHLKGKGWCYDLQHLYQLNSTLYDYFVDLSSKRALRYETEDCTSRL